MNNPKHICCADCRYAVIDQKASEYTSKRCQSCVEWEYCEVCEDCEKRNDCKARKSRKNVQRCGHRGRVVCPQQRIKWGAIQCSNFDSEYHRSLLNVTPHGEKQDTITWVGCRRGVAR